MDNADAGSTTYIKTTRPEIGCVVRRETLFSRLDGLPGRVACWISGPAGSGKSTLAASYVDARDYQSAWYQVDADAADIATFFHYLGRAARRIAGTPLPAFDARYTGNVAGFSRHYFGQLFSRLTAPTALVLDGLPALPADSPLRIVLEAGLAQVPRHCCMLVTSRLEAPASLARMRASGELVCLGADELRLLPEELMAIASLRGKPLGSETALRIQQRTQGWAAGVVLMLEHAKIAGHLAELPDEAAPQAVFDYLAGEIFERLPPETQQFLLRIACLQRTTAEVARSLSGEDKAARLLLNLAHNDYFVREHVGEGGHVFQLHPLLRDFLLNRAAAELPEALGAPALRRAAALLRQSGQVEDAVALLVESQDWLELASVVAELADTMLAQGRRETLAGWLELLPPDLLEGAPRLLAASAASRLYASPRTARHQFEKAYAGFHAAGDREGMIGACRGVIDATVLEFDDLATLDHWIAQLLALGQDDPAGLPGLCPPLIRALLLRDPGFPTLQDWLNRAGAGTQGSPAMAMARAMVALLWGDFATAEAITGGIATRTVDPVTRIGFALAAGVHCLLDGDYAGARQAAQEGSALAHTEGIHVYDGWMHLLAGASARGAEDLDGTRAALAAIETLELRRGDRAVVHYLRGLLAVSEDDPTREQREMKNALLLAGEVGIPWFEWFARLAMAQTLWSAGDAHGAAAQVRGAAALAERMGSPLLRVPTLLAEAAVELRNGGEAAALPSLRTALALGREHGFHHVVGLRPRLVAELCALALTHGIETEFARSLVRHGRLVPPAGTLRLRHWPWPFQIATLGGFQLASEGEPIEFSAKGPGRPVELLKVLVALGGQNVRADHLADALWPHVDADYAHKSFTATLHRLRRILEDDEALLLRDGRLSLNKSLLWLDTWSLDQVLTDLDVLLRETSPQPAELPIQRLLDDALALYAGPFLPDEAEQPAYIACRQQIRARLLRVLTRVARRWEEAGRVEAAADCYLRCIAADELCEPFYRNLMLCYQRQGDSAEALATYERLRMVLAARLKSVPSPETQAVFNGLQERLRTAS